ncbi:MAG TPA: hypothetical protein VGM64_09705 [Lacunisphaera sp.]|jgi:hypothetical protein
MKIDRRFTTLILAVMSLAVYCNRCAGFSLFPRHWGDVIVVTDVTDEGRSLTPATSKSPVYFLGRSLGCKLGSIRGDELPDDKTMNQFVTQVLAKQGYLSAAGGVHEPNLFLVVQWGYLEPGSGDLLWFLGYNPADDIAAPSFPGLLGPEVFRRSFRSRTIETVLDGASDAIYGIIVTAFDYKTANTAKPVIYWQTRIGLPANGKSMAQALPTMMLAAGPTIGRETTTPTLRDADDVREGHITLGELDILGIEDKPRASGPPANPGK